MPFKKSFIGFTKQEVTNYIENLKKQQESEKKSLLLNIQRLNQELISLVKQNNTLRENFELIDEKSLFLKQNERYIISVIEEAQKDTEEELKEISARHDQFIDKVVNEVFSIDEINLQLQKELASISKRIEGLAAEITIDSEVDWQINKANQLINRRYHIEMPKALDSENLFDGKISNIKDMIDRKEQNDNPKLSLFKPKNSVHFNKAQELGNIRESLLVSSVLKNDTKEEEQNPLSHYKREMNVLVLERNADTGALLKAIIEKEGYDVRLIDDGTLISGMSNTAEPVGLLIVDTLAPYVELTTLIKQVQKSEKWAEVPIIILSSEHNSNKAKTYLSLGATDYIEKPFNPKDLIAKINTIFEHDKKKGLLKGG
jgi:CheY-like chemotaxis protein